MANYEHLEILNQGVEVWNEWRKANPTVFPPNGFQTDAERVNFLETDQTVPDLSGANLCQKFLRGANLSMVRLSGANLAGVDLQETDIAGALLSNSDLRSANLFRANLNHVDLQGAILVAALMNFTVLNGANLSKAKLQSVQSFMGRFREANFSETGFEGADLSLSDFSGGTLFHANLANAILDGVNFTGVNLSEANFEQAVLKETIFGNSNLKNASLSNCKFQGPCIIDHRTFQQSGTLPLEFIRGCGLSDWEIESIKLHEPHLGSEQITKLLNKIHDLRVSQVILSGSVFISYSHQDKLFVDKLGQHFNQLGIRFWRDIHDATAGPLEPQVDRAIRHNPTVLLILSKASTTSDWVEHEVQKARTLEKETGRYVLCPITLDETWKTSTWPGRLQGQIEKYNILDFSAWSDEEAFSRSLGKLIAGLDAYYKPPISGLPPSI
ncbi:MAG: toll/interleukin-1 receptor domain-containing protein [Nitrospira sp.]|nr:toll/interleukin-1 receptor domain-containing protein [Nitrospira sp.]